MRETRMGDVRLKVKEVIEAQWVVKMKDWLGMGLESLPHYLS